MFIPNLSMLLHPLNSLLQKNTSWKWTNANLHLGERSKPCVPLMSLHYDPTLPLSLAEDALAYGVGAFNSHTFPDGSFALCWVIETMYSSHKYIVPLPLHHVG